MPGKLWLTIVLGILACAGDATAQQYEMIDRETGQTIGPIGRSGFIGSPIARSTVSFDGRKYEPGSIIVNTAERRLYYVLNETSALKYGIGVGRDGFRWAGMHRVTGKR